MKHLDEFDKLARKGVGLACIHYAVEMPKGKAGDLMKSWIGGYFETFWSVNPEWTAHYEKFPDHPVARGVRPFTVNDEWYYHMRFADDMKGVTPILTAVPPDEVHRPGNDAHGANPHVFARKGMPEHTAWAYQRPGRRPRLRLHRRPLPLELGLRRFPHGGAQRHRLDGRAGSARRRRALEDADLRGVAAEPRQEAAGEFQCGGGEEDAGGVIRRTRGKRLVL